MKPLAEKVVDQMYDNDWFSQWLCIERLEISTGRCVLKMKIRKEMLNGFAIAHGGITYSLADSALAFASNSYGIKSLSIETSINHLQSCKEGDEITAVAEEVNRSEKLAHYLIKVTNQRNELVAIFKGMVYRTSKEWFPEGEK